jgi:hypothetical protein
MRQLYNYTLLTAINWLVRCIKNHSSQNKNCTSKKFNINGKEFYSTDAVYDFSTFSCIFNILRTNSSVNWILIFINYYLY